MGAGAGCLACALLVVNNLRDSPSDTAAGKRTLAVRLGDASTRPLYVALLIAGLRLRRRRRSLAPVGAAGVRRGTAGGSRGAISYAAEQPGRELIAVLGATGRAATGVRRVRHPRPGDSAG